MPHQVVEEFQGLDFGELLKPPVEDARDEAFRALDERALSHTLIYQPITPEERLDAFRRINFRPHGIFLPHGEELRRKVQQAQLVIGSIPDDRVDERLAKYFEFQEWTGTLDGLVPGHWTGQMGVARSQSRFRLVEWGRRSGKSSYAAAEGVGVAVTRPRSSVWVCAPTMTLVSRVFDMIVQILEDLGFEFATRRNSDQEKLLILKANNSRIEGVSLEDVKSTAGAVVDLAIVDEAAQVTQAGFERAIMPPLTDHKGQALLLSSHEGDETFFAKTAEEAKLEARRGDGVSQWEVFHDATYDVNFFLAPQGINSAAIVEARKLMDPENFLEQYGAIPAGRQDRIYPNFQEQVHVGNYPYNPDHPVVLAVDPSYGVNPYAVLAIQDYGDRVFIVDEIYMPRFTFEELHPLIQTMPWVSDVTDVVIDSASPSEIERWVQAGYPAFPVFEKPKVEHRLPIIRYWLRDPSRYFLFHRERVNYFLAQRGMKPNTEHLLPPKELRLLMTYVEESLSGDNLTPEDLQRLKGCARLFVNMVCVNTVREFKTYKKEPQRRVGLNIREAPRKSNDHAMDAAGYYFWQYKRFEITGEDPGQNMVKRVLPSALSHYAPKEAHELPEGTPPERRVNWLSSLRDAYNPPSNLDPYSMVRMV